MEINMKAFLDMHKNTHKDLVMDTCKCTKTTLSHFCYTAIFCNLDGIILPNGVELPIEKKEKTELKYINTERFIFLEQNPNKKSEPSERAKAGAKIIWIIAKKDQGYLGKIENGVLETYPDNYNRVTKINIIDIKSSLPKSTRSSFQPKVMTAP